MNLAARVRKLFLGRSGSAGMIPVAVAAAYAFAAPTPAISQQITISEERLGQNIDQLVALARAGVVDPAAIAPELAGNLRLKLELYGPDAETQAHLNSVHAYFSKRAAGVTDESTLDNCDLLPPPNYWGLVDYSGIPVADGRSVDGFVNGTFEPNLGPNLTTTGGFHNYFFSACALADGNVVSFDVSGFRAFPRDSVYTGNPSNNVPLVFDHGDLRVEQLPGGTRVRLLTTPPDGSGGQYLNWRGASVANISAEDTDFDTFPDAIDTGTLTCQFQGAVPDNTGMLDTVNPPPGVSVFYTFGTGNGLSRTYFGLSSKDFPDAVTGEPLPRNLSLDPCP